MTTNSSRLSGEEQAEMAQRLQICLGLAAERLYTIISADHEILSDTSKADPLAVCRAEERRKLYSGGGLRGARLKHHLKKLTQSVDYGFRILRHYGPPDGGAIADRFVKANQGFVTKIVKRYRHIDFLPYRDLKQIGQLGLCTATLRYDPQSGTFSNFAYWWIKSFISRGLTETGRLIRLPVATIRQAADIERSRRLFFQKHGRPPSIDELAEAVKLPRSRLNEVLPHMKKPWSLDARIKKYKSDVETSYDLTPSDELSPEAAITVRQIRSALETHLERLSPMEREILVCQLNLRGEKRHQSFEQLAKRFNYSHEGIRKMYNRTLDKLREWLGPDFRLD